MANPNAPVIRVLYRALMRKAKIYDACPAMKFFLERDKAGSYESIDKIKNLSKETSSFNIDVNQQLIWKCWDELLGEGATWFTPNSGSLSFISSTRALFRDPQLLEDPTIKGVTIDNKIDAAMKLLRTSNYINEKAFTKSATKTKHTKLIKQALSRPKDSLQEVTTRKVKVPQIKKGMLLVAHPMINRSAYEARGSFRKCVILINQHSFEITKGFILNLTVPENVLLLGNGANVLQSIFPDSKFKDKAHPLFCGGTNQTITCLHRTQLPAEIEGTENELLGNDANISNAEIVSNNSNEEQETAESLPLDVNDEPKKKETKRKAKKKKKKVKAEVVTLEASQNASTTTNTTTIASRDKSLNNIKEEITSGVTSVNLSDLTNFNTTLDLQILHKNAVSDPRLLDYSEETKSKAQAFIDSKQSSNPNYKMIYGYCVWGHQQLAQDLRRGYWLTVPTATAENIFDADVEHQNLYWQKSLKLIGTEETNELAAFYSARTGLSTASNSSNNKLIEDK